MKPLLSCAGAVAALLSTSASARPLDVVFVVDTTGSMANELNEAKDRIKQIAAALQKQRTGDRVRVGVVAFRDRGDDYVTLKSNLAADIDKSFEFLTRLDVGGGGDTPEDVLAGLAAALHETGFDDKPDVDRSIFLIADAPAHLDYKDGPTLEGVLADAAQRRIVIHAIGCRSLDAGGIEQFRQMAYATEGTYQHIGRVDVAGGPAAAAAAGRSASQLERAVLSALDTQPVKRAPVGIRLAERVPPAPDVSAVETLRSPTDSDGSCGVEVMLPPGLDIARGGDAVTAELGADALVVTLETTTGKGTWARYDVARCGTSALPLVVNFTGGER